MTLLNKIETLFDNEVRPQLALHQGDISIVDISKGILTVRFLGLCSNCPSASNTVESLVSSVVLEKLPEISKVVLETGVSDDLMQQARDLLNQRHSRSTM